MATLGKDKDSNEVGDIQISNSEVVGDRDAFKFLPKIEFSHFWEPILKPGSRNALGTLACVKSLIPKRLI